MAFAQALYMAKRARSELTLLWVAGEASRAPSGAAIYGTAVQEVERLITDLRAEQAARLGQLADEAEQHGVNAGVRVEAGEADEVIVAVSRDIGADLIVTGTKGLTGVKRFFMGSVAASVVRTSENNVLVARGQPAPFRHILVPVDFSPASERALSLAISLAEPGATIDLMHAWQYPAGTHHMSNPHPTEGPMAAVRDEIIRNVVQRGEALVERYRTDDSELRFIHEFGPAAAVIQDTLEAGAYDLVAMGTHGYRGFRRFMLGSVAEATVRYSPCSVLIAHIGDAG